MGWRPSAWSPPKRCPPRGFSAGSTRDDGEVEVGDLARPRRARRQRQLRPPPTRRPRPSTAAGTARDGRAARRRGPAPRRTAPRTASGSRRRRPPAERGPFGIGQGRDRHRGACRAPVVVGGEVARAGEVLEERRGARGRPAGSTRASMPGEPVLVEVVVRDDVGVAVPVGAGVEVAQDDLRRRVRPEVERGRHAGPVRQRQHGRRVGGAVDDDVRFGGGFVGHVPHALTISARPSICQAWACEMTCGRLAAR